MRETRKRLVLDAMRWCRDNCRECDGWTFALQWGVAVQDIRELWPRVFGEPEAEPIAPREYLVPPNGWPTLFVPP